MVPSPISLAVPVEQVVPRCLDVLGRAPAGLISDIDGVLSAIAPTPGEAFVAAAARGALARLARRLDLVAIVSGRAAADGEAMVGVPGLVYVGNHGLERSERGTRSVHPGAAGGEALGEALDEVGAIMAATEHAGAILVENKGVTGTVHYRLAADPEAARAVLLPAAMAAAEARGLVVTEGRLIVELRPSVAANKGTAIVELVAERRLRGAVFFGDDVTDVDGFAALRRLRDGGAVDALCVGVLAAETPPRVVEAMDVGIAGVGANVALLGLLADALDEAGAGAGTVDD